MKRKPPVVVVIKGKGIPKPMQPKPYVPKRTSLPRPDPIKKKSIEYSNSWRD